MKDIIQDVFYDYLSENVLDSAQLRISRGCENCCTFCPIPRTEGQVVEYRSLADLKADLQGLWDKGVRHLNFTDDNFLLNVEEVSRGLSDLGKDGISFAFSFSSPVKLILKNQKFLIPLRQLGLRSINLKIINANQDVLNRYGVKQSPADLHYAIQILQALRYQIHLEYILFEPLTTIDHLENDLVFLEKARLLGLTPYTDILTTFLNLEVESSIKDEYNSRKIYLPSSEPFVPYQIIDSKARQIFYWLTYYHQKFGEEWKERHRLLLNVRMELAKLKPNWVVTNMGQELMHILYDLRIIPYDLFKALLSCAGEERLDSVLAEEIDRQSSIRLAGVKKQYKEFGEYYGM